MPPAKNRRRADVTERAPAWRDTFYVTVYQLARSGMTNDAVAAALGYTPDAWRRATRKRPAVADALKRGRDKACAAGTLIDGLRGRLPPDVRAAWDAIHAWAEGPSAAECPDPSERKAEARRRRTAPLPDRLEAMLADGGERARMWVWVAALANANFSAHAANRAAGVSPTTPRRWARVVPEFAAVLDALRDAKGDFYEAGLLDLVAARHPAATVYANRTYNRGRGYGVVDEVTVTGAVDVNHRELDWDALVAHLSPAARAELVAAAEALAAGKPPPKTVEALPG